MPETPRTPENQAGQKPTRSPEETEARLKEKEQEQRGGANKVRTQEQIDEVRSKR
ncbi:MAG TPA: hypothetical protein VGA16_03540 [Candidatus Limnocylindria bacterium]